MSDSDALAGLPEQGTGTSSLSNTTTLQQETCIETTVCTTSQESRVIIEFTLQDLQEPVAERRQQQQQQQRQQPNKSSPQAPSSTKSTRNKTTENNAAGGNNTTVVAATGALSFFDTDWLVNTFSREEVQLPEHDDEASQGSSASSAYFEATDFKPRNWIEAMDAPTFGLAVIALTTVLTHPVLFLAGAIAAFGAATAVGAGYDWSTQNSSTGRRQWLQCGENGLCGDYGNSIDTVQTVPLTKDRHHRHDTTDEATEESSTTEDLMDVDACKPVLPAASAKEDALAEDWIDDYYPDLMVTIVEDVEMVGLNAVEFFMVFFDNSAPYNFLEFQKKRGDIDISYGSWEDLTEAGSTSMHPAAEKSLPSALAPHSFQGRVLTFKAKTNSFFGPMYATTTKHQRILIVSKKCAVLESRTFLADIPYCDRFTVMERWVITASKNEGRYTAKITTSCEVLFTKSCTFESQIRSKSSSTLSEVVTAWCKMAQEALKLTEQAKQDRIRRSHTGGDAGATGQHTTPTTCSETEGIEVDHSELRLVIAGDTSGASGGQGVPRSQSENAFGARRTRSMQGFRRSISQMVTKRRDLDSLPQQAQIIGQQKQAVQV